ncbi:MAG: DUF444 family protein [Actinomycetia bacterium]|nr:DUF444 family protein [Actinomycetes bacterium]
MSTITHGDADWGGQGSLDQARHADKLKQAIKERLPQIVGQTPIISGDPRQPVPVRVPILQIPQFRPKPPSEPPDAGIGQGPAQPGDIVGQRPRPGEGSESQPGTQPGEHTVTVELDRETLLAWVFEDLHLPRLQDRQPPRIPQTEPVWRTRRKHGPLSTLAIRQTLKEALARSLAEGHGLTFHPDDLRFRAAEEEPRPSQNAVVYLLRDISWSMAGDRTYLARVLAWWIVNWLRWQYQQVQIEWWVHDAEPERVETEARFFGLEAGSGTLAAPAYRAMGTHQQQFYPAATWNVYWLHLTDGEVGDREDAVEAVRPLLPHLNALWLVEIQPWAAVGWDRWQLGPALAAALPDPPYRGVHLRDRTDVGRVLRELLEDRS